MDTTGEKNEEITRAKAKKGRESGREEKGRGKERKRNEIESFKTKNKCETKEAVGSPRLRAPNVDATSVLIGWW